MASTSDIYTLLRLYAKKQHRTLISVDEFCSYLKKYSQHYVSEQPNLERFTQNPLPPLKEELTKLSEQNKILLQEEDGKTIIIISAYFIDNVRSRYKAMNDKPDVTFPSKNDLPKDFPQELITTREAADVIYNLFNGVPHGENVIYSLEFKREVPSVLLPEGVTPNFLMKAAIAKLRLLMHRSEQHDYFQQKLLRSNGGREISVKNFFSLFVSNEEATIEKMKSAGDSYYFWNQLLLFMRQDYEKIEDKTVEDTSILQAVNITEICVSYYKNKSQVSLQRDTALKNLELAFSKKPYYFDSEAIAKFVDTRGVPLLGQYTEDDLNEYLHNATTTSEANKMPPLLTFKVPDGTRYFVLHEKVFPLTMKLCTESRKIIHDTLTNEWFGALRRFSTLPEMKDIHDFNNRIEKALQTEEPILYALLTSPFLSSIYYEALESKDSSAEKFKIFIDGILVPYSEILMLTQHSILTDAKIKLPVWYTIPFISFICSLFSRKSKKKKVKSAVPEKSKEKKEKKEKQQKSVSTTSVSVSYKEDSKSSKSSSGSKRDEIKAAAARAEKMLVPPDSSLDSELTSYLNEWNHLLDKDAKKNLTEDVNSLIRDYLRKILRTASAQTFELDRIKILADTLVKTPSLQKIQDKDNLQMYIQLYILRLIKKA